MLLITQLLSYGIIGGPDVKTSLVKEEVDKNLVIQHKIICKFCEEEFENTRELQSHLIKKIKSTQEDWTN